MAKILGWVVLIFVVLFAIRMINFRKSRSRNRAKTADTAEAQPMVRCTRCGVFLPRQEARALAGGYACADNECVKR
jgi:hypothetical protein